MYSKQIIHQINKLLVIGRVQNCRFSIRNNIKKYSSSTEILYSLTIKTYTLFPATTLLKACKRRSQFIKKVKSLPDG